jgi:sialic acid synthase SpsE
MRKIMNNHYKPIEIIAEIAQGYEGNSKLAELLVKGALSANADAVKMQIIYADELCTKEYPYYKLFESLEMTDEVWKKLVALVHESGKKIYFDVYGKKSLKLASEIRADGVKISSTDFHNSELLLAAFKYFDTVYISIGGVSSQEIDDLLNLPDLPKNLTLLHGFQAEPTEIETNNLARIRTLKSMYPNVGIGFMDHTLGTSPEAFALPLIALGLGINVLEKHITLDHALKIEDHISALSIDNFEKFITLLRSAERSVGSPSLILSDEEVLYKKKAGKIVVASKNLKKGQILTKSDTVLKRVSVNPVERSFIKIDDVLGSILLSDIEIDQPIIESNLN